MVAWSLGWTDADQRLIVVAGLAEKRVVELEPDPAVTHWATKDFSGNRGVGQPSDFGSTVGAWVDITKLAVRTDRNGLGRNVTAIHAFRAGPVLDDIYPRSLGVPILSDDPLDLG
jgi:hypothetical protein